MLSLPVTLSLTTQGYPVLRALVGPNVPDLRGMFLRGHGWRASHHWGEVWHGSEGLARILHERL